MIGIHHPRCSHSGFHSCPMSTPEVPPIVFHFIGKFISITAKTLLLMFVIFVLCHWLTGGQDEIIDRKYENYNNGSMSSFPNN